MADAVDARRRRKRRVHDDGGGPGAGQVVGCVLGVDAGDQCAGEQPEQQCAAGVRDLVQMEVPGGPAPERAFGHHRQHAGAGGRLQHDIARPDRRGPERRVGERQGRRKLLQADLFFRTLRVRRLQRGDGLQHLQHGAGAVRTGPGMAAHGPAVAADEQHDCQPRRPHRRPSRPRRPGRRRRRMRVSWRPAGWRRRAAGRPPGPARGCRRRRTARHWRKAGSVGRPGRSKASGARERARMGPAPYGRRAWISPSWNCVKAPAHGAGRILPRRAGGLPSTGWPASSRRGSGRAGD